MHWDPETYNTFKNERLIPFSDLLKMVKVKKQMDVIDLGCGTGEITRKLADALPGSHVLGIDTSAEMLKYSEKYTDERVRFERTSIEDALNFGQQWDLIFSNSALHWVPDHNVLFQQLISCLKPDGQLVVQMPNQNQNIANRLLKDLAEKEPFRAIFHNLNNNSPVLATESYAELLSDHNCKEMTVMEKIYPLVFPDTNAVLDWVSGAALLPYLEKLNEDTKQVFIDEFKRSLELKFTNSPVFYPFKRIIIEASF